jgi:polysaccharide pyruvyl transferase WcaK-like protein
MKIAKALFRLVTRVRKDVDFIFYEIHPEDEGRFDAFSSNLEMSHCTRQILTDIEDACREVSSLDVLITTRLHFGVMAMSYGIPSIAFAGAEKTRLLYNRIGRGEFYWPREDLHKILLLFLTPGALRKLARSQEEPVSPAVVDNAMLHYDRLIECLRQQS